MKVWIHINGIQEGPYELGELPLNRIKPDTPVWYEGLDYWKEAMEAPEVARLLVRQPAEPVKVEVEEPAEPAVEEITLSDGPEQEEIGGKPEAEVSETPEAAGEPVVSEPEAPAEEPVVTEPEAPAGEPVVSEPETPAEEPEESVAGEPVAEEPRDPAAIAAEEAEALRGCAGNGGATADDESTSPYGGEQPYGQGYPQGGYPQGGYGQPYGQGYPQGGYGQLPYCQPAPNMARPEEGKKASTYLLWSVLITLLCCNPLGIIAIITSIVTGRRNDNYDYAGAKRMSEATAWWLMLAIVTTLISVPFMSLIIMG